MRVEPGLPTMLVEHGNIVFRRDDGREVVASHKIVDEDTFEQYRQGYRCVQCDQVQSVPFPERCEFTVEFEGRRWQCPMRIRDEQLERLSFMYRGSGDWTAPDPYEVLDVERDDWKQTRSGIVVPGGLN